MNRNPKSKIQNCSGSRRTLVGCDRNRVGYTAGRGWLARGLLLPAGPQESKRRVKSSKAMWSRFRW